MERILGQALKKMREERGVSLESLSRRVNISYRYLKALEDETFDMIPGKFYIKHYLKEYLRGIDADYSSFLNEKREYLEPILSGEYVQPGQYFDKLRYLKFRKRRKLFIFLPLILAIALISTFLVFETPREFVQRLLIKKKDVAVPALSFIPSDFDYDLSPLNVRLTFTQRCWIQVRRGGLKMVEQTFEKGEELRIEGYQLSLYIGNPAGVELLVNGKTLEGIQKATKALRINLNPENLEELFK